jgi:hypothetical protein
MAEVRKLDSRRRAVFPDRFSPGDLFLEEQVEEDRVVFRRLRPAEVPVARVERIGGKLMVRASCGPETIRRAIRLDRDSR